MQCDYCDSKATVFFTQVIGDSSKKSSLCGKCAEQKGVTDPQGFLLDGMNLSQISEQAASAAAGGGMVPQAAGASEAPLGDAGSGICPGCGFAFDDLKKTGRLGCSQCYQFFREEILHNLGGMHKDTCHVGRVPEGMLEAFKNRQQLEKLELEMKAAIADEDYEKAAALRDEIGGLTGGEPTVSES